MTPGVYVVAAQTICLLGCVSIAVPVNIVDLMLEKVLHFVCVFLKV